MFKILKSKKSVFVGAGAIMLAALFWSLDGVFIRPKFYMFPAPLIVFLEHALGFIVLSPFIILGWRRIKTLKRKDWLAIFWVCVFGGLIGTIYITKAFFAAVAGEVTFATVVILQKLQPVFALVLARFILGEKLSKKFYFWAGVAIISAYVLAFGKNGLHISEIDWTHSAAIFAVIAAFAFGSSTVFGKRIVNHLDFGSTTALRFGITSVLAFVLILLNKDLFQIGTLEKINWIYLVVIVFTSGAAAMFIYYFGLKRVRASVATICELFWPFSAVVLDYFINGNVLNSLQIIATIILLFAFYKVVKEGGRKGFQFQSRVVSGMGRGERLGFPTINLESVELDLEHGVYLINLKISNNSYSGLMHFGPKETFNENVSMEIFVKNNISNLSGAVAVEVVKKIRDIKKFDNEEELKKQIEEDAENLI